jgi:iron complex transport system substrate-binding protein
VSPLRRTDAPRFSPCPWLLLLLLLVPVDSVLSSPRELRDDVGRRVHLDGPVRRIVSLAPSVTETLFALGSGEQVVGVTDLCDDPPAARSLPKVGGMVNPDWEAIVGLRPDLLIASTSGNDAATVSRAEKLGLALYFTDAPDLDRLLASVRRLGSALGIAERGAALSASLESRLRALENATRGQARPRVLFLVWVDPPVVPGSKTFLDDALRRAGLESVTADAPAGWPTFDLEAILLRRPDWILAAKHNAPALASLKDKPGWKELEAVKRGRVLTVSETIERPSPRVVDAMEELHREMAGAVAR